eukprot:72227-Pyramimonas_sp.AAC.1
MAQSLLHATPACTSSVHVPLPVCLITFTVTTCEASQVGLLRKPSERYLVLIAIIAATKTPFQRDEREEHHSNMASDRRLAPEDPCGTTKAGIRRSRWYAYGRFRNSSVGSEVFEVDFVRTA